MNKYKKIIIKSVIILAVVVAGFFLAYRIWFYSPVHIYEVAVQVRDQINPNAAEDAKTSLKKGDVIVVLPEGHKWSDTEKISYLLLKMRISEKQAEALVSADAVEKKVEVPVGPDGPSVGSGQAKKEKQTQAEVRRTRLYRIKTEELKINADDLLVAQPYLRRVFDWNIVEQKIRLE